jgi:CubicO group peptidase (beta-lactamase class C family)
MNRILILGIASFVSFAGVSQNVDKTKLDTYFDTLAANDKFMGSIAVSRNGEMIYTKTVGFADIERGLIANENSTYRIASISKTFTAVLILNAVEEKKLNLNQTLDKFFPEIKNAKKITISQMLYHRSGIFDDNSFTDHANQPETEQQTLERILNAGSDFKPGQKARYGNANFILLSYILEKIYKMSYSEILEEKIIKSLELKNTYCENISNVTNEKCKSYRYRWEINPENNVYDWKTEPEIDLSLLPGAVGIISNAADLAQFSDALFSGKLISIHSLQQMKTIKDGYGMGLFQMTFADRKVLGHPGNIDGFNSIFAYFPDSKISFALTSNGLNYNSENIVHAVFNAVNNVRFEIPEFEISDYHITSEDLDEYTGVYSSEQIPVNITVIKIHNTLFGAKGASFVPLKATEKNKFVFDEEGLSLEFNTISQTMVLKEGGKSFNFKRVEKIEFKINTYETDEELDKYIGIYSSEQIHIKITVIKAYNKLFAHATGRNNIMLLETTENNKFEFAEEEIIFEFNPSDKTLAVKQNRRILNFARENG